MSIETIEKTIENLKKLKGVLKKKMSDVDYQLQRQKTNLSQEKEKKLKHIKNTKTFFKN